MTLESLMVSLAISTYEKRVVSIFDLPGVYLQIDLPENKCALLLLEGKFIDSMVTTSPGYAGGARIANEKKVRYLRILKASCNMIESVLLW